VVLLALQKKPYDQAAIQKIQGGQEHGGEEGV
jgi:hypothetical protein